MPSIRTLLATGGESSSFDGTASLESGVTVGTEPFGPTSKISKMSARSLMMSGSGLRIALRMGLAANSHAARC